MGSVFSPGDFSFEGLTTQPFAIAILYVVRKKNERKDRHARSA